MLTLYKLIENIALYFLQQLFVVLVFVICKVSFNWPRVLFCFLTNQKKGRKIEGTNFISQRLYFDLHFHREILWLFPRNAIHSQPIHRGNSWVQASIPIAQERQIYGLIILQSKKKKFNCLYFNKIYKILTIRKSKKKVLNWKKKSELQRQ